MIQSVNQATFSPKLDLKSKLAAGFLVVLFCCALGAPWLRLPFTPQDSDWDHVSQPPFQWHEYKPGKPFHWLGTNEIGLDVFANMVFGAKTAVTISFPAMLLAAGLGVYLGSLAGYYGDRSYKMGIGVLLAAFIAILFFIFYFFLVDASYLTQNSLWKQIAFKIVVVSLSVLVFKSGTWLFYHIPLLRFQIAIPLDVLILKLIELIQSVPRLLLVLSLAAFTEPSLPVVISLSALTYWPAIARLVRSEMLKVKELPYLEAARALGFTDRKIILKHALPNLLTPIIVACAFGIGSLMALESTLSFLGIGIPPSEPSWGRILSEVKANPGAWWLALFPGLVLCATILSVQTMAQWLIRFINPK